MVETNVVVANPDPVGIRRHSAFRLRADVVRSLAGATRAALEAIGLASVVTLVALVAVPGLRAPAAEVGASIWASIGGAALEEPSASDVDSVEPEGPKIGRRIVLEPADNNAALYLARRYHVADEAVRVMVAAAHAAGKEWQIDPLLILSVVAVESSMNPFAQSPVGATGLMQVMPDLHGGKFVDRGDTGALDPVANIQVGSQILSQVIRRGGSVERGLQLYVGAGNLADDGGYANRVLSELGRLKLAASGSVAAALAAGLRSDTRGGSDSAESMTSSAPAEMPTTLVRKEHTA